MFGFEWIRGWWYARQRQLDMDILWPACLDEARGDLDKARTAFAVHAFRDPAWMYLGRGAVYRIIDNLGETW